MWVELNALSIDQLDRVINLIQLELSMDEQEELITWKKEQVIEGKTRWM